MKHYLLTLFCCISYFCSIGQDTVFFRSSDGILSIGHLLSHLSDSNEVLSIDDVKLRDDFTALDKIVPSIGKIDHPEWLKFTLKSKRRKLLLELENVDLTSLEVYCVNPLNQKVISSSRNDKTQKFSDRQFKYVFVVQPITIPANGIVDVYMRIETNWPLILPLKIGVPKDIVSDYSDFDFYMGIFFGILILMLIVTAYIYLTTRDKAYLFYGFYLISLLIFQFGMTGYGFKFLWPNNAHVTQYVIAIGGATSPMLVVQFVRYFLKTRRYEKVFDKILKTLIAVFGLYALFGAITGSNAYLAYALNYTTLICAVIVFLLTFKRSLQKDRYAMFLLVAWAFLITSVVVFILNNVGATAYNPILYHSIQLGFLANILVITFGMSDRVYQMIKEKQEQVVLQNLELEEKVKERTTDLEVQNLIIKSQIEEKEVMLKEIHHRVKNNLQIISSLLRLQAKSVDDDLLNPIFDDAQQRIIAMSLVHDKLYNSENLAKIEVESYFAQLGSELINNFGFDGIVRLKLFIDDIHLAAKTMVPVGLLVNEILTNALKYAFEDRTEGELVISMRAMGEYFVLEVSDDGIGMSEELARKDAIGMQLIEAFIEQLDGTKELWINDGVKYRISFKPMIGGIENHA